MNEYEITIYISAEDNDAADEKLAKVLDRICRHHWWAFWRKCEWNLATMKELEDDNTED